MYIPKINVIPSPVLCVSELYLCGSNMSFKTGFFHSLEFGFFFSEPAALVTRSKVITLRRNTLEQMPVSTVLGKCIADALLPSAKESSTWFLSLVSACCMDFYLSCSLPFHYFSLFLWFCHSHIIYLDVSPKKSMFVEMVWGIPLHSQIKFLFILPLQYNLLKYTPQINSLDETNGWVFSDVSWYWAG